MKVLYSSRMIKSHIDILFETASPHDKRVILVAYIGKDHAKFLPNPKGIEIICSPTPGATSSTAVSELQAAGARMYFSDRLHMKVYWSEKRGCVIASANLSRNAFGERGLKEAGVFVGPNIVKIDELRKAAKPYAMTERHLRMLKVQEDSINKALASVGRHWSRNNFSYSEWYVLEPPVRQQWKLGWWMSETDYAQAGLDIVKAKYGKSLPAEVMNVTKKQAREGDWFLNFRIKKSGKLDRPYWMYVDHVVRIRRNEDAYEPEYPYQAIQALPTRRCSEPPFKITASFYLSFEKAVKKFHIAKIINDSSLVPSPILLRYVNQFLSAK
jgi:hypothetical protein